jgi:hypothetical protein
LEAADQEDQHHQQQQEHLEILQVFQQLHQQVVEQEVLVIQELAHLEVLVEEMNYGLVHQQELEQQDKDFLVE